jgi:hypothetical protein
MALLIAPDGRKTEIKPPPGKKFSLDEVQQLVGLNGQRAYVEPINMKTKRQLMFVDEDARMKGGNIPVNLEATRLLTQALGSPTVLILGNALIVGPGEF